MLLTSTAVFDTSSASDAKSVGVHRRLGECTGGWVSAQKQEKSQLTYPTHIKTKVGRDMHTCTGGSSPGSISHRQFCAVLLLE